MFAPHAPTAKKDIKDEMKVFAPSILPVLEKQSKRELYIKIFKEEFLREMQFIWDVANERTKPRDNFTAKLAALFKDPPINIPVIGDVVKKLGTAIEFTANQQRDEEMGCIANLYNQLDLPRLSVLIDVVAREAYRRYEFFIENRLNDDPEDGVIPFAKVGVARVIEHMARKKAAVNPEGFARKKLESVLGDSKKETPVEFSESFLLAGLVEGRSGQFIQGWTNNSIKLNRQSPNKIGRVRTETVDAEDVYARSAFLSFGIQRGNVTHQVYTRAKAKHKEISGWEKVKSVFKGDTEVLYDFGYVKPNEDNAHKNDPLCGVVVMPTKVITERYDFKAQDAKQFSRDFQAELQRQNLSIVQIDKETLKRYISWFRQQPQSSNSTQKTTVADYLRLQRIWLGAKTVVCQDDLSDLDLKGVNLSHMDLSGSILGGDLTHTNFANSYLYSVRFAKNTIAKQTNFNNAHCEFMHAEGVDFTGSDFTQADCSYAKLSGAKLQHCKLLGTNWHKTDLTGITSDVDVVKIQGEQLKKLADEAKEQKVELYALKDTLTKQSESLQQLTEQVAVLVRKKEADAIRGDDKRDITAARECQQQLATLQQTVAQFIEQQQNRVSFEYHCKSSVKELQQRLQSTINEEEVIELRGALQTMQLQLTDLQQKNIMMAEEKSTVLAKQMQELTQQDANLKKQLEVLPQQFKHVLSDMINQQTQRYRVISEQAHQIESALNAKLSQLTGRVITLEQQVRHAVISDEKLNSLKTHAQAILKQRYLGHNEIRGLFGKPFKLEDQYINLQMLCQAEAKESKDEKAQKFQDRRVSSYEDLFGNKKPVKPEELFKAENGKTPTLLLIQGRAGIGKTTFVHYATREWSKGKLYSQFDWVFTLTLRELRSTVFKTFQEQRKSLSVWEWIYHSQFRSSGLSEADFNLIWLKHIEANQQKVLFVLDGFDEVPDDHPCEAALKALLEGEYAATPKLITSRPYGLNLLTKTRRDVEIVGFTDENIQTYVQTYFSDEKDAKTTKNLADVKGSTNSENLQPQPSFIATKLIACLKKQPTLWGNAHIPVNLNLLCGIADRSDKQSLKIVESDLEQLQSMTTVYETMESKLYERTYLERPSSNKRLPGIPDVRQQFLFEHYQVERNFLAKLAFLGLQNQQIILSRKEYINKLLKELFEKNKQFDDVVFMQSLRNLGLIKPVIESTHTPEENQSYEFMHLTFQEYYAAIYVAECLTSQDSNQKQMIETLILKEKYNPRWQIVWWFVAGLLKEKYSAFENYLNLLQGYVPHLKTDQPLSGDLLRHYKVGLLARCMDEGYHQKKVELCYSIFSQIALMMSSLSKLYGHSLLLNKITIEPEDDDREEDIHTGYESPFLNSLKLSPHMHRFEASGQDVYFHAHYQIDTLKFFRIVKIPSSHLCNIVAKMISEYTWDKTNTLDTGSKEIIINRGRNDYKYICHIMKDIHHIATPEILTESIKNNNTSRVSEFICGITTNAVTPEHLKELSTLLNNKNESVCRKAAYIIREIGVLAATYDIVKTLLYLLKNEDRYIRWAAVKALCALGQAAVTATLDTLKELTRLLDHEIDDVRKDIAKIIGHIGTIAATSEIINKLFKLLYDKDRDVRFEAKCTIKKFKIVIATPNFLIDLLELLSNKDTDICELAITFIPEIAIIDQTRTLKHLAELLNSKDDHIRKNVLGIIILIGPAAAISDILIKFPKMLSDEAVQIEAVKALGSMGEEAVTTDVLRNLSALLKNKSSHHKTSSYLISSIIVTLEKLGLAVAKPDILDGLLLVLKNVDYGYSGYCVTVDCHAAIVLGNLCKMASSIVLKEILKNVIQLLNNKDNRIRKNALSTIDTMGLIAITPDTIENLLLLLSDKDIGVQVAAILGKTNIAAVIDRILKEIVRLLREKNEQARKNALAMIDAIGLTASTPEIVENLLLLLSDKDIDTSIATTLGKINTPIVIDCILKNIVKLLGNENSHIRKNALEVIVAIGLPAATPEILKFFPKMLANDDTTYVAIRAVDKMGVTAIIFPEILQSLLKILDHAEYYDRGIKEIFNKIGRTAAYPEILKGLSNYLLRNSPCYEITKVIDVMLSIDPAASITPNLLEYLLKSLSDDKRSNLCSKLSFSLLNWNWDRAPYIEAINKISTYFIIILQQKIHLCLDHGSLLILLLQLFPCAYLNGNISCQIDWDLEQQKYLMRGFMDKDGYEVALTPLQAQACRHLIPAIIQQLEDLGKIDIELLKKEITTWPAIEKDPLLADSRLVRLHLDEESHVTTSSAVSAADVKSNAATTAHGITKAITNQNSPIYSSPKNVAFTAMLDNKAIQFEEKDMDRFTLLNASRLEIAAQMELILMFNQDEKGDSEVHQKLGQDIRYFALQNQLTSILNEAQTKRIIELRGAYQQAQQEEVVLLTQGDADDNELQAARSKTQAADQALKKYCQSRAVIGCYLNKGIEKGTLALGLQTVLLYAQQQQMNFTVWRRKSKVSTELECVNKYQGNSNATAPILHLLDKGNGNYSCLVVTNNSSSLAMVVSAPARLVVG